MFDLIIIGAGPGGYEAAILASEKGMKVGLIEKEYLGGTCLNHGCIPTKTLLHAANLYREFQQTEIFGVKAKDVTYDMESMQQRKNEVIEQLRAGIDSLMKRHKITVFEGTGTITNIHTVAIQGKENITIEGENILVATGSVPSVPPIPGIELPNIWTSNEILEKSDKVMERLVIIGGGVIGMEFASIYSALGCQVTVIEALDRILFQMDKEIAQNLKLILKKRGVDIHTSAKVISFQKSEKETLICYYEEKGEKVAVETDGILVAAGRRANTAHLTDGEVVFAMERDKICVNENYQTNYDNIYAIGDVIGGLQLAHMATAEGNWAVCHMKGEKAKTNLKTVPSCVYTNPEIASVGITAEEAKELEIPIVVKKYLMSANGKSLLSNQERGFIKVVAQEKTGEIIGAQMMCARATDMISEFTMAITQKMTLENMASVIRPHPTFSEGITEVTKGA